MKKELQNLAWKSAPKDVRNAIISIYYCKATSSNEYDIGYSEALERLYGKHNLTSDTEPEEMLMVERKKVQEYKAYIDSAINGNFSSEFNKGHFYGQKTALDSLFSNKCLPDKEPSNVSDNDTLDDTKDNTVEKELNLCELLKGCVGEWFYVTPCGEMELKEINKLELKQLHFSRDTINCFTKTDGRVYENGSCIIYPSRALYEKYPLDAKAAWDEWASERKPKRWTPQIGEHIFWVNSHGMVSQDVCRSDIEGNGHQLKRRAVGNEFKTGKEAQQAAEGIREYLKSFHEKKSSTDLHN